MFMHSSVTWNKKMQGGGNYCTPQVNSNIHKSSNNVISPLLLNKNISVLCSALKWWVKEEFYHSELKEKSEVCAPHGYDSLQES